MRIKVRHLKNCLAAALTAAMLAACSGPQSALDAAGLQSGRLSELWWIFFAVTGFVYLSVMAVVLAALLKAPRAASTSTPDVTPNIHRDKRVGNVVKAAVAVTVVVLFAMMIVSFRTGRALNSLSQAEAPITIKVKGQQWWWEVVYEDAVPSNNVTTDNEIHVPVGRPIKVELRTSDVIHSFWLPNMHGKKDLIPNYPTTLYFQADRPGTYWGQCAEFCGYEHAKMRFIVVAETQEEFDSWLNSQRQTPPAPTDQTEAHGQQIFLTSSCIQCHTIKGTPAAARVGPDLTHIASRPYIAAGSLENTREHLRQWVTDPQSIKPGIKMPMNTFTDDDLNALVTYLQSLK
jgi:cytochrome c oxidase subunit 2